MAGCPAVTRRPRTTATSATVATPAQDYRREPQPQPQRPLEYADAVERGFGAGVDYGQAVTFYEAEPTGPGRYSPPKEVDIERAVVAGNLDEDHISTSIIERQNLTMRMSMRRFTRLTNGFSKKVENMKAAVSLQFAHYNFVRMHKTLKCTPVMTAGVERGLWSLQDLVDRASA